MAEKSGLKAALAGAAHSGLLFPTRSIFVAAETPLSWANLDEDFHKFQIPVKILEMTYFNEVQNQILLCQMNENKYFA